MHLRNVEKTSTATVHKTKNRFVIHNELWVVLKIMLDEGAGGSEGDDSSCDCVLYLLSGIGKPTLLFPDISTCKLVTPDSIICCTKQYVN